MLRSLLRPFSLFSKSKHTQPQSTLPLDPTAYYQNRKLSLSSFASPYPYNFHPSISIQQFLSQYSTSLPQLTPQSIAGRITKIRNHGKLSFIDIKQNGFKVQVAVESIDGRLKRGDVIGVKGHPFRTNKGQLTIKAEGVELLAPCLHMLPEQQNLKDVETRQRKRYLDLITNHDTHSKLKTRAKVIQYLRTYLLSKDFLSSAGGAIAKPFQSYLHDMDMKLYMRIAPQLYLKQLLIGGIPKVFEIGKNFRNEGIDTTHNPEFTTLEMYEAYKEYQDMMEVMEEMMKGMVGEVMGGKMEMEIGGKVMDFSKPWKRVSLIQGLEQASNTKFPLEFSSPQSLHFLHQLLISHNISCPPPFTHSRLLDKLSSHFLQPLSHTSPLFIYNYPTCMSPLAKPCPDNPQLTQRFEGFINGWEICNSYTELNDPEMQRKNTPKDLEFVEALEYGLMPCAGLGVGVDRVVMVLTGSASIQEVIAFPLMKKEE